MIPVVENAFTETGQDLVFIASKNVAFSWGVTEVRPVDMLLAAIQEDCYWPARILEKMNVNRSKLVDAIKQTLSNQAQLQAGDFTYSAASQDVIEKAIEQKLRLKDNQIGTEHIFFALIQVADEDRARILQKAGVTLERVLSAYTALKEECV
jgi:ATP-dependent Clp protease ATP-binding subunit ClpA